MTSMCQAAGPDFPLVQGLLAGTDCQLQTLIRAGYGSLFVSAGAYSAVLTGLLTIFVALVGYRLLLGSSQLTISDLAITLVKIGAVLALVSHWSVYQTLVYRVLFDGPQQIANVILHAMAANGGGLGADVFQALQRAFDELIYASSAGAGTAVGAGTGAAGVGATPIIAGAAPAAALGVPTPPTVVSGASGGLDATLLLASALALVLSSLGLLLATKVVLALLLAVGPVFIALILFDSTRGVFAGWVRASLAFALTPLTVTILLSLSLTVLEPWIEQLEAVREKHAHAPGTAIGVVVVVFTFAMVSFGAAIAATLVAGGFKLPGSRPPSPSSLIAPRIASPASAPPVAVAGRADRLAAALVAQDRRGGAMVATINAASSTSSSAERRGAGVAATQAPSVALAARMGQASRRPSQPRSSRAPASTSQ